MVIIYQHTLQSFSSDNYYGLHSSFCPSVWDPQISSRPALSDLARRVLEIQRRLGAYFFPYVVRIQQDFEFLL